MAGWDQEGLTTPHLHGSLRLSCTQPSLGLTLPPSTLQRGLFALLPAGNVAVCGTPHLAAIALCIPKGSQGS